MASQSLEVWSIRDGEGEHKAYWKHVGRAYVNRDGSINVFLEALPLGAKLQIRETKKVEEAS